MSKTKIEQYPNSLMAVSKLFSKRNNYFNTNQINIDNPEREEFYKNKEQYKNNIEEILSLIVNVNILLDEAKLYAYNASNTSNPNYVNIYTSNTTYMAGILRKIIQDLTKINKKYKDTILKKSKNYNLYDLQEIENDINILSNKYEEIYSNELQPFSAVIYNIDLFLNNIEKLFEEIKNLINQTSQIQPMQGSGIHKINYNTVDKYLGGSLYCCADSLAN